jgi:AcrR family transcriptional regulator
MTAHKTPDAPAPLSRKERAGRTRARILTAARAEFTAKGYHATTMAAIASAAGVAVQTVYFVFGTKPALLQELLGVAVMGLSGDGLPVQRPEDTRALASFVAGAIPVYSRAAAVAETARVAAQTDSDVADVYTQAESRRVEEFSRVIHALADHDALRADLTIAQATAVLTTVFGPQSYLSYTAEHQWSDAELADWMSDALARLLLR